MSTNNTIILIILYIVYLFLFIKLITNFRKYKIDKVLKKIDEKMFKYTTVITNYDITIEYENVTERYKLDDILQVVWGKIPYFIIRENKKFKRIFLVGLSVDTPIKKAVKNRLLDAVKKILMESL